MSHIFISYARKDEHFAQYLEDYLVRAGFDVWIDYHGIPFGKDWINAIFQAIGSCAVLVVVMTPTSEKSSWVHKEFIYAEKLGKPIIPVLRAGDPFPYFGDLHYVDVTGRNLLPSSFLMQLAQYVPQKSTRGINLALSAADPKAVSQMPAHHPPPASDPRLKWAGMITFAILVLVMLLLLVLNNPARGTSATPTANTLAQLPTEADLAVVVDTPILTDTVTIAETALSEPTLTVELTSQSVSPRIQSTATARPSATTTIDLLPTVLLTPFIFTPTLAHMTVIPSPISYSGVSNPGGSQPSSGVSAPIVNQNTSSLPTTIVLPTKPGNDNSNPPTATKRPVSTNTPKPPTATRTPSNTPTLTLTPTLTATTNPGALQLLGSFVAPGGLPNGIACDGQFLWLSDNSATIFKVDMSGNPLGAYSAPEGTSQGIVWVGDRYYVMTTNRNRVYAFQIQGFDLKTLSWFQGPGQVTGDNDMAWDGTNIWYSLNFNVYKLGLDGTVVGGFTSGKVVNGLAWDGTNFWMAVDYSFKIVQVNPQGQVLATFQVPVSMINGLDWCDNTLWVVGQDQIMEPMKVYRFKG